ncbi:hypothetical protein K1T71_011742 [Dendrolimus kikuchii]|uniref:Uncharacterized protein n=1 Tax=Dendrolimus kikuchii TaxID=765133 RepID=A0ACC1CM48_9NEOP|nr:hypothetical protein K1T71_011742 [Dendrolimus kikuchii]
MEHARPPPELNFEGGPVARADAWKRWRQQFQLFVKASGVNSESSGVQASLLVNLIGPEGFDVYQTFTFKDDTEKDNVDVIIKKFDEYFGTKVNITLLRYNFFMRNQEDNESIQSYVTALRLLSKNCEFSTLRDDLIKDRIVCGIRNTTVRDRLLRCEELDLDKAIKVCQAQEVSQESGKQLGANGECSNTVHVHGVERRVSGGAGRQRGRRGGTGAARRGGRGGDSGGADSARQRRECPGCGGSRCADDCPAQYVNCFCCGHRGHYARMCKSRFFHNKESVRKVCEIEKYDSVVNVSSEEDELFFLNMVTSANSQEQWSETLYCSNGSEVFKLDSGADINVISYIRFRSLGFSNTIIKTSKIKLQSYTGNFIPIKGVCELKWVYKNNVFNLNFAIADIECASVLGRKSCEQMGLIKRINTIRLSDYSDLFSGLGCLPGKYSIVIDKSIPPVISASRKIPLGLRERLADELKKMENLGVIRKVLHPTQWVHPLVLVAKKNNGIRVCLDPRELNVAVRRAHFQLPTLAEMAARMHGAAVFSVLDANSGFWTVQLDDASADLCTFATPFGRYQFLRLPFGISCASEVFHGKLRQLLENLQGVDNFIDDVIIWGRNRKEHDERLKEFLNRAREINLKFNREKCRIGVKEVHYLGHIFDANGIRPDDEKVRAIRDMPPPTDKKGVERFLGAVNYLSKFIPNYSQRAVPLTNLLKKENAWRWEQSEANSFKELKECVCSAGVLALYDVGAPAQLSVDASRDAVGAVLLQGGRPVEFSSRTLTDAQRRYAQVEKEMLAIVFACERFHQYIFGKQRVVVESDHKPLESIFKKPLMSVPARLQRMMLRLQNYDLIVTYKPGKYMYIADTLSRAPLPELYSNEVHENNLYQIQMIINSLPISNNKLSLIKKESKKDTVCLKLTDYINKGWPEHKSQVANELKLFWPFRNEFFIVDSVIFRNGLVLIPQSLRKEMLSIVHEGHMGIDRCKRRARQVMYWPNMSRDVELYVRRCSTCQECLNAPAREPLIPIEIPELPWNKVGSDIFEVNKKYFLIIVDYYSNYVEVCKLLNISSNSVISNMKEIFSRHGIPATLISDNGTQYSSHEFRMFAREWGFNHVTSSPHYPQANGKSERTVQTIKTMLKKSIKSNSDFQLALLNFRNTPRDGLSSPAQLLMGRRLRCRLPVHPDLLKPKSVEPAEYNNMIKKQSKTKEMYDKHCRALPKLNIGDDVICVEDKKRCRAKVVGEADTPRSYIIQNKIGSRFRRNRRHLIKCDMGDHPSSSNSKQSCPSECSDNEFEDADSDVSCTGAAEIQNNKNHYHNNTAASVQHTLSEMPQRKAKLIAGKKLKLIKDK